MLKRRGIRLDPVKYAGKENKGGKQEGPQKQTTDSITRRQHHLSVINLLKKPLDAQALP